MKTANPWYAIGARKLLEMRQGGEAPTDPVVVSLTGEQRSQITLIVKPEMPSDRLDWRMLANLEVWLEADASVPLDRVLALVDGIAKARPSRFVLRFDRPDGIHDVEIGVGFHNDAVLEIPAQHEFVWSPINLTGSRVGAQFRKTLIQRHPIYTRL